MNPKALAKKRLMFIQREDYNLLAYSFLILLSGLDCSKENSPFRDFRKAAYLIEFINEGAEVGDYSREELIQIYSRAQIKKTLLHHLLYILEKKGFIGILRNDTHKTFNVWIKEDNIPADFFNKEYFKEEFGNVTKLKSEVSPSSLKTMVIKDLTDKFIRSKNMITWEF